METLTRIFEEHRSLLRGIAYRMLGSLADADDMVQETWLRWSRADMEGLANPRSWLVTVVSRLCLDRLKSAQVQREEYFGVWLPDPYPLRGREEGSELDESVSIALMLLLEKLSPAERAGFLLHDVFGYSFDEVAKVLGKTSGACRKMVSRAREQIRAGRPRFEPDHAAHELLLSRFLEACREGEMTPLLDILHPEAEFHSDSGGKAITAPRVLDDPMLIAKFFVRIAREHRPSGGFRDTRATFFNGVPGILVYSGGQLVTAIALEVVEEKIIRIYAHRNPEKLRLFEAR